MTIKLRYFEHRLRELLGEPVSVDDTPMKGGFICDVLGCRIGHKNYVLKVEVSSDSTIHKEAKDLDLYNRESLFYNVHGEELKQRGLCPECRLACKIGGFEMLLLLNVLESHSSPAKAFALPAAVKAAAQLHQHSSDDLPNINSAAYDSWIPKCRARAQAFVTKWHNILTKTHMHIIVRALRCLEQVRSHLNAPKLQCLCHGDFKLANMFYSNDTDSVILLDWQYAWNAHPVTDIAFLMVESCQTHEERALVRQIYLDQDETKVNADQFDRALRLSLLWFPMYVAFWFGTTNDSELIDMTFPERFIRNWADTLEQFAVMDIFALLDEPVVHIAQSVGTSRVRSDVDRIHVDVCDGLFTSNCCIPSRHLWDVNETRPVDVHLMVTNVLTWIPRVMVYSPNSISFHATGDAKQDEQVIEAIRHTGAQVGIVVPVGEDVPWGLLEHVDVVIALGVKPGASGQAMLPGFLGLVNTLRACFTGILMVDGGVNDSNVQLFTKPDVVVCGSYLANGGDTAALIR